MPEKERLGSHNCQQCSRGGLNPIIELLLEHGADINAKDNAGRTGIGQMLQNGRQDLATAFRRQGGGSA